jgi:F-type H+-transporting ATPase subunit gamma
MKRERLRSFARDLFLKKEVDEVRVVTTRFVNTLTQQAECLEFLPVGKIKALEIPGALPEERLTGAEAECLFEPNQEAILSYLLSHYLNIYIYEALLNAKASEQSARMVSMKNATDNANTLIKDLDARIQQAASGHHHDGVAGDRRRSSRVIGNRLLRHLVE